MAQVIQNPKLSTSTRTREEVFNEIEAFEKQLEGLHEELNRMDGVVPLYLPEGPDVFYLAERAYTWSTCHCQV